MIRVADPQHLRAINPDHGRRKTRGAEARAEGRRGEPERGGNRSPRVRIGRAGPCADGGVLGESWVIGAEPARRSRPVMNGRERENETAVVRLPAEIDMSNTGQDGEELRAAVTP